MTASMSDFRFTTIPILNSLGGTVCCANIFQSDSDKIPVDWITGIDVMNAPTDYVPVDDNEYDVEFVRENSGPGKLFPCGPTCEVNGVTVPCFVAVSPHGGITSKILADLLKHLDDLNVFPRGEGLPPPFIVIDGHNSRFGIEFLSYIHDARHIWIVCLGVPYGTHLWQMGDSSEMNGKYKMALTTGKEELVAFRSGIGAPLGFKRTDITPLCNKAWNRSFADVVRAKKALCDRGWAPLNRALLLNEEVLKTREKPVASVTPTSPSTLE